MVDELIVFAFEKKNRNNSFEATLSENNDCMNEKVIVKDKSKV